MLEDHEIIELYWQRDETAIKETDLKYHAYCQTIANDILENSADAEECVSDTWLKAWQSMPPQRPSVLRLFLARICRNTSLDLYRRNAAGKRDFKNPVLLDELAECIPDSRSVEKEFAAKELAAKISRFLRSRRKLERQLFLRRYFRQDSYAALARSSGLTENNIRQILYRIRQDLKKELEKEGYLS
ncbi:MAG: sigma-70 family RNA polymerase sigma factor [Solobacterium sp.]|nr:sigma-70 family RNA polymerase sigma factor [Solobacterium sp.]